MMNKLRQQINKYLIKIKMILGFHGFIQYFESLFFLQIKRKDFDLIFSLWTLNIWGPPLTLQDCLQAFFQADELTGDNMYSCEKCEK
jgi:hypothetical protein